METIEKCVLKSTFRFKIDQFHNSVFQSSYFQNSYIRNVCQIQQYSLLNRLDCRIQNITHQDISRTQKREHLKEELIR